MADLFKSLKPTAHLSKNGFDLSRKHVFSSQAGMALPCLSVETVPGDYFEIDVASLSRTQTFNTAAFLRGKQRFDFFFVPYTQLWHPFNQFITQRDDKHSSRQLGHIYTPVVRLSDIISFLYSCIYNPDSTVTDRKDFMNYSFVNNAVRLLDLLGYGDYRWLLKEDRITPDDLSDVLASYEGKYVNVFRLAAYQHIWYDYYRNKYYDVNETGDVATYGKILPFSAYVEGFNFDDIVCTSFSSAEIFQTDTFSWNGNIPADAATQRMYSLLKLNYVQWKKDIYTTAMPSQQFGAVSSVDLSGINILNNSPSSSNLAAYVASSSASTVTPNSLFSGTSDSWSIPSAFDVLSLRKAEALQQWKQQTLRAGNMTDSNFEAHFGVKPYYEGDENVRYLGSFSSALQVNAVETTAQASGEGNTKVGDLAATGTMVTNGSKLKFECKDYGIIMCIASYLPESEYSSNALDKANTLYEQFDWFTPEFQNLGLEAITHKEFDFSGQDTGQNSVIGYAPRYYMYKSAVDKVFGEFKDTSSLYVAAQGQKVANGTLEGWVSPRAELSAVNRNIKTFYVDPTLYNNVMGIYASADQETDYFLNNVFFDIKAIRPMSVLGLPQF